MSDARVGKLKYEGPGDFSVEVALERIESMLGGDYGISRRTVGLLLLQGDSEIEALVERNDPAAVEDVRSIVAGARARYSHPLEYVIALRRQQEVDRILKQVVKMPVAGSVPFREKLSRMMMHPVAGLPVLFVVLYFGLYKFVGGFGAGVLVDFLEGTVFEQYVNPFVVGAVDRVVPWQPIRELVAGEYGVITLGVRYAVAIILPIVSVFFITFSIIEDSGYLPRLAMLIDRLFKKMGLSGRAVIPVVLGFGCDTMATMVTRTLPTRRERLLATMLLSLAVPCSAQLGVILALFDGMPGLLAAWAVIIFLVFIFIGYLAAKVIPGKRPSFYMEVPPLRLPRLRNVLVKTFTRVKWYLKEVMPIFMLASVLIWVGQITRVFDLLVRMLEAPVKLIGLPADAAKVFLFGFFRRDYGVAGLYDMSKEDMLSPSQLLVAAVALTLFLPCIAHFLMTVKERGLKTGIGISVFVLVFSFVVAFVTHRLLLAAGVS